MQCYFPYPRPALNPRSGSTAAYQTRLADAHLLRQYPPCSTVGLTWRLGRRGLIWSADALVRQRRHGYGELETQSHSKITNHLLPTSSLLSRICLMLRCAAWRVTRHRLQLCSLRARPSAWMCCRDRGQFCLRPLVLARGSHHMASLGPGASHLSAGSASLAIRRKKVESSGAFSSSGAVVERVICFDARAVTS